MRARSSSFRMSGEASGEERIKVFTRVRPLSKKECLEDDFQREDEISESEYVSDGGLRRRRKTWINSIPRSTAGERCATVFPDGEVCVGETVYKFDGAFDDAAAQEQVFEQCGLPLVDAVCEGFNAALIAYGQTGSGKTYSMLGDDIWQMAAKSGDTESNAPREILLQSKSKGVLPRALERIFDFIEREAPQKSVYVKCLCSYMEIYNEKVYDLLSSSNSKRVLGERGLDILEDEYHGVNVPDLLQVPIYNLDQVYELLWRGALNRAIDATDMNEYSSRSHTIFQVVLEQHSLADGADLRLRSKLNLVDLAGSEKWRTHQLATFSNQRIQEMTSINQSLSNLGNCIRALLLSKQTHIPYRNSKLTRILQDSLGGNSKTSFLVTLSPAMSCMEETISSLQFADRAKRVMTRVRVNEEVEESVLIKRLENRIRFLESELEKLGAKVPLQTQTISGSRSGRSSASSSPLTVPQSGSRPVTPVRRSRVASISSSSARSLSVESKAASVEEDEEMLQLTTKVACAARRLQEWSKRNPGAKVILDEKKTLALYESWLYHHLIGKPDASKTSLSQEDRLLMAEWAVLMQAQKLKTIQK